MRPLQGAGLPGCDPRQNGGFGRQDRSDEIAMGVVMLRGPALAHEQRGADSHSLEVAPFPPGFQGGVGAGGDPAKLIVAVPSLPRGLRLGSSLMRAAAHRGPRERIAVNWYTVSNAL